MTSLVSPSMSSSCDAVAPLKHPLIERAVEEPRPYNDAETAAVAVDPVAVFERQGFMKLPSLLRPETCQDLRASILKEWQQARLEEADTSTAGEVEGEDCHRSISDNQSSRFSSIRQRAHRWDFKLEATATVRAAMHEILLHNALLERVLTPLLCSGRNDDKDSEESPKVPTVVLAELGALLSEPGAPAQDWHADTAHTGPDAPDCICLFVTLQETPAALGPTDVIPQTHTRAFHATAVAGFPPKGVMPPYVAPKSAVAGYTHSGEACLMDCRLYHRGGANTATHLLQDDNKRVVFYFTVRSKHAPQPCGFLFTILEHLKGMPLHDFVEGKEKDNNDDATE